LFVATNVKTKKIFTNKIIYEMRFGKVWMKFGRYWMKFGKILVKFFGVFLPKIKLFRFVNDSGSNFEPESACIFSVKNAIISSIINY